MEAAGIDILIIGREANARYVAGVPRLWIAARGRSVPAACSCARPARSTCVSTWDEGVPDDIPHENLHGITFNGANTLQGAAGHRGRGNGARRSRPTA